MRFHTGSFTKYRHSNFLSDDNEENFTERPTSLCAQSDCRRTLSRLRLCLPTDLLH